MLFPTLFVSNRSDGSVRLHRQTDTEFLMFPHTPLFLISLMTVFNHIVKRPRSF